MKSDFLFFLLAALILGALFALWAFTDMSFPWFTFVIIIAVIVVSWFVHRSQKARSAPRRDEPRA